MFLQSNVLSAIIRLLKRQFDGNESKPDYFFTNEINSAVNVATARDFLKRIR